MARSPIFQKFVPLALVLLALAGCEKGENPAQPPQAAAPSPAPKSAVPNSFDDVTAQLDPGGEFYLYLSTEQWLGKLSKGVDTLHDLVLSGSAGQSAQQRDRAEKGFATLKDVIHKSGLEEITGLGASSFAVAPGLYRNKVFIHHYADKGSGILWSIYGKDPHALTGLDLLPTDTATASFGDFDLAQLINFLRQEADQSGIPEVKQAVAQWQTQFAGVTGLPLDDVLASLGGSGGAILTLDATNTVTLPMPGQPQTIPAPRLALLIGVKNDLIFKRVDMMLGGNPAVIKVDEPDLRMRTMPVPMIPGLNLRPSVAQWNGLLVIASDDKLIRDMIAVQKGGPGFKSTAEFTALSAGLPTQGNSFGVVTQRFADTYREFESRMLANKPGMPPGQVAVMQRFFSNYQRMGHNFAVLVHRPDGWLSVAQGNQGSSQLVVPLVIAPVAIGASLAIPAMSHIGMHLNGSGSSGPTP